MTDEEKQAFVKDVYEGVLREIANRTPDSLQETERIENELQSQIATLEKRIFDLENMMTESGGSLAIAPLIESVRADRRARTGLMMLAKRTQNGSRGPLVDLVEALIGE